MTPADEMPTINKRGIDTIMSLKKKIAAAFIACAYGHPDVAYPHLE